jgi:hypothetical protein
MWHISAAPRAGLCFVTLAQRSRAALDLLRRLAFEPGPEAPILPSSSRTTSTRANGGGSSEAPRSVTGR